MSARDRAGAGKQLTDGMRPWGVEMRAMVALTIAICGAASTGCSFAYTKGPQPQVQPPPPCTTSNEAPVTDTVFAAASVGAVVVGSLLSHNTTNCGEPGCGLNNGLTGDGILVLGGISTLIFVSSAITGYNRTAACRGWLEGGSKPALPTQSLPDASNWSWLVVPPPECSSRGDAPLLCASRSPLTAEASDGK